MEREITSKYNFIFKALAILAVITLISNIFRDHLQIINIALIHILPVIFVAIHGNLKATFFITFISVILLNFLYIPPLYSIDISNELYIWSFGIFVIVGWIITVQARDLSAKTKQNELKESILNIISHDLRNYISSIYSLSDLILNE